MHPRMYSRWFIYAVVAIAIYSRLTVVSLAQTVVTNTRTEVAQMAGLWEVDSLQVSPFANAQYPSIGGGTNLWQFLFPSGGINSDGDEDIEMGIDSSGTGKNGNNQGYSPIHTEVINQTSGQLNHLNLLNGKQGKPRGI